MRNTSPTRLQNGYFRGIETYNFVRDITSRFDAIQEEDKRIRIRVNELRIILGI